MADSDSGGEAPVKRGRGRPKGTTKSGKPYVPKEKVPGRGRGRPKGAVAKAPPKPKVMKEFGTGAPKKGLGRGRAQPKYDDFSSDEDIQEVQFVKMEKGRPKVFGKTPFPRGKVQGVQKKSAVFILKLDKEKNIPLYVASFCRMYMLCFTY